jgi:hypothetical protein
MGRLQHGVMNIEGEVTPDFCGGRLDEQVRHSVVFWSSRAASLLFKFEVMIGGCLLYTVAMLLDWQRYLEGTYVVWDGASRISPA